MCPLDLNGLKTRFPSRQCCPDCRKTLDHFDMRFRASHSSHIGLLAVARSLDSMGKDRIRSRVTRFCCLIKVKDESFNHLDRTMKFERRPLVELMESKGHTRHVVSGMRSVFLHNIHSPKSGLSEVGVASPRAETSMPFRSTTAIVWTSTASTAAPSTSKRACSLPESYRSSSHRTTRRRRSV